MAMRGRFAAGVAAGVLLASSIMLVSFAAGGVVPGVLPSHQAATQGAGSETSASTTTTVTYSSATSVPTESPANTTGGYGVTSTVSSNPAGFAFGSLSSAFSGSSSLGSLVTQPASTDAFVLLPLALAILLGVLLYRAGAKNSGAD